MKSPSIIRLFLCAVGPGCALLVAAPAFAANPCDALYNAGVKSVQTPHHVYSSMTKRGGKPKSGEAIFNGGIEYLQLNGKWMRSPMTNKDMVEAWQEKLETHPDTCTFVSNQIVDGQPVSVYKVHDDETGTDEQLRILNASGLIQGAILTLPDGSSEETHHEYANVQAPAGVK